MSKYTNPHQIQSKTLLGLLSSLHKNHELIFQMTKREVIGRYKGSIFGLAWSFFNPILMLVIYTFVFSVVFKSRWGSGGSESKTEFALILFSGMVIFGLFSETITKSPTLILNNINYVKKVVFPLEILPVISLGAALFHMGISFMVLVASFLVLNGFVNWTIIFLPLVLVPLIFLILGLSWFLASLGVFARDVGQTIGILVTLLMFLSPVFYPVSAVPEGFRPLIMLNPLSFIIEQSRESIIFGHIPDLFGLFIYMIASSIILWLGYSWFQRTRKGFADVL